jgi:hypothetical protein
MFHHAPAILVRPSAHLINAPAGFDIRSVMLGSASVGFEGASAEGG